MATHKQWTGTGLAGGRGAERVAERPARRLSLRIEALEQRIAPDGAFGDDPIGFTDPPPTPPGPGFP